MPSTNRKQQLKSHSPSAIEKKCQNTLTMRCSFISYQVSQERPASMSFFYQKTVKSGHCSNEILLTMWLYEVFTFFMTLDLHPSLNVDEFINFNI